MDHAAVLDEAAQQLLVLRLILLLLDLSGMLGEGRRGEDIYYYILIEI